MSKKRAILCIDDEPIILESLKEQIEKNFGDNLIYETAENADEANEVLRELSEENIDILVIVSDWLMPGMKGDEFLVQAHQLYPEIVPIMLTGHASKEAIQNAIENANLFSCINKPWHEENLIETIRSAMQKFETKNTVSEKEVILCIDDEEMILDALKDQLEDTWGSKFIIETVDNPEEAIEIFNELREEGYKIPVVISDYIMPYMKGDELLKKIHEISPETHKILLTGQASVEGVANAINWAKLYRYIPKPWDKEDLALTIKEAIRSYVQENQIRSKNKELASLNASLEEKVLQRTKELEVANATKDKFFSIIGHDLKGSFNTLIGFSEILIEDFEELDNEGKMNFLNRIRRLSENAYKLLQNLLDWARVQTGNINYEPEYFDLEEISRDILEMQQDHAQSKMIKIKSDVPRDTYVYADKNMIHTVVRNLFSNSLKFTNQGGEVKISCKESKLNGGRIDVSITDTGIGMSDDKVSKLFKISEKVKTYGTAQEEGTGLGLILCKEFVEKNNGDIKVESRKGEGSIFTFTLHTKGIPN
ncbi:response regulator [Saccharicrinis sp. FJH62]|uniref:sensor histidine kinase n=1 Tax=Saccharicrinis sp. FJH62 TaxID=3344657 RepID=UPI0035D4143F